MKISVKSLSELLSSCDEFHLECDGLSRVIDYILYRKEIEHKCYKGYVDFNGNKFYPHWFVVSGGYIIDYGARAWLGKNAPHGVFKIRKVDKYNYGTFFKMIKCGIEYGGDEVNIQINSSLFIILAGKSYDQWEIDSNK